MPQEEPETTACHDETVPSCGDDITITLGQEIGPDRIGDSGTSDADYDAAFEANATRAAAGVEYPEDSIELLDETPEQYAGLADLEATDADGDVYAFGRDDVGPAVPPEFVLPGPDPDLCLGSAQPPVPGPCPELLPPQACPPDDHGPDVIGARHPIDIQIDYDPIGLDIDIDVIGPAGL
jgi:hypothetical protein